MDGMPRPAAVPTTSLGAAIQAKRGGVPARDIEGEAGVPFATLYRLEAGRSRPSVSVARALGKWLGWPLERVLDAAEQPPDLTPQDEPTLEPEPEPAPAQQLARLALRLPSGKLLGAWEPFGGAGQRRPGAGLVVATASEASASGIGLAYQDREPGRAVEERRDALDAWLVEQGARPEPSTSAAS